MRTIWTHWTHSSHLKANMLIIIIIKSKKLWQGFFLGLHRIFGQPDIRPEKLFQQIKSKTVEQQIKF